jgi:hypothetical protein
VPPIASNNNRPPPAAKIRVLVEIEDRDDVNEVTTDDAEVDADAGAEEDAAAVELAVEAADPVIMPASATVSGSFAMGS